jgi:hypothetical protein
MILPDVKPGKMLMLLLGYRLQPTRTKGKFILKSISLLSPYRTKNVAIHF